MAEEGAAAPRRISPEQAALFGLLVLVFAAKMPLLQVPYYWDDNVLGALYVNSLAAGAQRE